MKMKKDLQFLKVNDLTVQFKTQDGIVIAVDRMNFTLNKGEKLGIVGESGSGKSVTSLSIMGLVPNPPGEIIAGSIQFKEQNLLTIQEESLRRIRGNEISMIFQEPMTSLNPILTCGFQIAESLMLHKKMRKKAAIAERLNCLLVLVYLILILMLNVIRISYQEV